ncbi:MMPL family transporter [Bacillus sp. Au-Bac7]|nr:MMPL family transporter [Bacillus sp. Au-Bac7]MCE4051656.1 MMPL family transporter [Bacillus sp. Au-Bac7]
MKNFIPTVFRFVSGKKGRWITLFAWICLVLVLSLTLPQASSQKNENAANLPEDSPSQEAEAIINKEFPNEQGTPALITFHRDTGLSNDDLTQIQELAGKLTEEPVVHQQSVIPLHQLPIEAVQQQVSEDETTIVLPVLFEKSTTTAELEKSLEELQTAASDIFSTDPFKADINDEDTLSARTTGPVGIAVDAAALFSQGDLSLLIGTVVIVLICLLVIYRSPILAIIPLIGVGIAYLVISPVLGGMGKAGWIEFDSQSIAIMTVLLFGAGTDYCLFLISKYRSLLKVETKKEIAMANALRRSGGAVAMSGLTVVFSLIILLLAEYGSIQRFAVPFSLSILIMMVASLTLVPAILAIFGRVSFFPFMPKTPEMEKAKPVKMKKKSRSLGEFIGKIAVNHPWKVTIITTVFLGVFALLSLKMESTYDTLSSFPDDMPSREGFSIISEHFSAGELAPAEVVVQTEGSDIPVEDVLNDLPFVANVSEGEQAKNDSGLFKYSVELNTNPYSNEAMEELPDLRAAVEKTLADNGITESSEKVWIGGITAEQLDTKETTDSDARLVIPVIVAMIAVLLLAYLRSITATIYLIATVLLSYFSALGLGWVILHYGFGVEAIQGLIPLYAFVFIVALGEDYNIFMISSIWKKSKEMPLSQAIKEGVAESGGVITSAGVILAATFMVLTTLPIQILVHFGTITAIGVLLDTFVVRPFLVPSITALCKKAAFWPATKHLHESNEQELEKQNKNQTV